MLEMTPQALAVVRGSHTLHLSVQSWLGDRLLAEDVPVDSGGEEVDLSLAVPERISLTVPIRDRGVSWDPITPDHPLAAYGQRLRIAVGVDLGRGRVEWLHRGDFVITKSGSSGDAVSVEAVGLLHLVQEARFAAPFQPTGTFEATLRSLVEPALTVDVSASLVDRAVRDSMAWDEDRLAAVFELLDAWPAKAAVDEVGVLRVTPAAVPSEPVLDLTDGEGGTVVQWAGEAERANAYNVVVARSEAADGTTVQGVVYDQDPESPLYINGPFNPLPVPYFFFSPLLTTADQCRTAAAAILSRLRSGAARKLTAEMVPHPGLQVGDVVRVTGRGLVATPCQIETLSLPYTAAGGSMTLTLRVV